MKTVLLAAVSGVALSMAATGAMAGPFTDVNQFLSAAQTALDTINIAGHDGGATTQTAINAGNLIDLSEVNYAGLGLVWQTDFAPQFANNYADSFFGSFDKLTQEATNVANSINGVNNVVAIDQLAVGPQIASNEIGYGSFFGFGSDLLNATQTATNVSNIASLDTLDSFSTQTSHSWQTAANVTTYFGAPSFFAPGADKVDQEATNATNLLTITGHLPTAYFSPLPELSQTATGAQLATNTLTVPDLSGKVTQAATNVANSITNVTGD